MNVLVINSGSSSLKYQLFNMKEENILAKGIIERIGMETAIVQHDAQGLGSVKKVSEILEHKEGLENVLHILTHEKHGVIESIDEIHAIGHRVAHGGEEFSDSALVDESVIRAVEKNIELAPLHNPANLKG